MSRLEEIPNAIQAKIQSLPYIASAPAVPTLIAWSGDLENTLARLTNTQCIQVVVCVPVINRTTAEPSNRMVLATSWLLVMEKPLFNRQQSAWKSGASVAEAIACALHNWSIPGSFGTAWTDRIESLSTDYGSMIDNSLSSATAASSWMAKNKSGCSVYRILVSHIFEY